MSVKKPKKKMMAVEVVGELEREEEEEQHNSEDEDMQEALKDFAEGQRVVKLYRYPGELGGRPRLLGGIPPEDFKDILIQQQFGGGRYYGRWRNKDGTYIKYNFEIEGEPKVFTRAQERASQDEEGNPYPYLNKPQQEEEQSSDGLSMVDVLRMMAETRKEAREEMRTIIELMRPTAQPPDATEKVFSLVEKIVPLISQGGGDGGNSNPWLFALSQLKEPLMKMVDTIHVAVTKPPVQSAPGPVPPGARRLEPAPIPQPAQPAPAPQPEPKSEDDMLVESFRPYLGMLVKAAEQGKDPGLYSDLILDQIPVFAYDRLRVWLNKPGCLDQLESVSPRPYTIDERAWFDTLRGLLLDALNEELGYAPRSLQPVQGSDTPASGSADSPLVS